MTRSSFQIRDGFVDDAEQIAALCQQLDYQVNLNQVKQNLENILADSKQAILVAMAANADVVGWIHVFITDRIESSRFAEIGGLVVDINYRNQNVGSTLFEQASAWAKNQGEQGEMKLRVRCADQRIQAHNFYQTQGMRQTKTQYIFDI